MNAPFKPDPIQEVLASACVSISDLKKDPAAVVAAAQLRQVAILNRNRPVAYVISPRAWERIIDLIEDVKDGELVEKVLAEGDEMIEVTLEELSAGFPETGDEAVGQAGRGDASSVRAEAR